MTYKVCPRCGLRYTEPPALSRYADAEICSNCGMDEAMRAYFGLPPKSFADWYQTPQKE